MFLAFIAKFHTSYDDFKGHCRETSKDEDYIYPSFDTKKENEVICCKRKEKGPKGYTVCIHENNVDRPVPKSFSIRNSTLSLSIVNEENKQTIIRYTQRGLCYYFEG